MTSHTSRHGSALVICTIVLVIVSALAVGMASFSGANVQIAGNQQAVNRAFASAESGLEVMRFWFDRVRMPSSTAPSDYLQTAIALIATDLQDKGIANFRINTDGSIPTVMLDTTTGQNFRGQLAATSDPKVLRATVMGTSGTISRTITVDFHIEAYHFPIFNFGWATKGPIRWDGNPTMTGATQPWEADIYIESLDSTIALQVEGNSQLDGHITIGNPDGVVDFQGDITWSDNDPVLDHHVDNIEDPEDLPEFPEPNIPQFRKYATGPVINKSTDLENNPTWTNATIAAGTDPNFSTAITIRGILYIEAPNQVIFKSNVTLEGMIVADGHIDNVDLHNQIYFGDPCSVNDPKIKPSNFASAPYPPGAEFDAIRAEQGSCILAPGFGISFIKNFSAVNGVIAASGLSFDWNASAVVKGTLINYSNEPTVVNGNIAMDFDRAAMVEVPAGFDLYRVLIYNPISYSVTF